MPWRIAPVGQENHIEDVRFLFSPSTTPPLWPPKREYNAVSAERSMKFGSVVRVETLRHLTKDHGTMEEGLQKQSSCSQAYGFATITVYVGGTQARLVARNEFKISQRSPKGGGVTTSFTPPLWRDSNSLRASKFAWLPPTAHSNYSERLWLHARTFLVALENRPGWPGESH